MYYSKNLRYLRLRRKSTQSDIGKHLGIGKTAIGAYESGETEPPIHKLEALGKLFDVDLPTLMFADLSKGESYLDVLRREGKLPPAHDAQKDILIDTIGVLKEDVVRWQRLVKKYRPEDYEGDDLDS